METATEIVDETAPVLDAPIPALTVEERLASLEAKMDQFIALASDIKNAVEPTLDALKSSPIAKMMGI